MTCKYCGDHNEECLCDIECDKNNDNKRYNCM